MEAPPGDGPGRDPGQAKDLWMSFSIPGQRECRQPKRRQRSGRKNGEAIVVAVGHALAPLGVEQAPPAKVRVRAKKS
jgi:hypothetical protein